MPLPRRRPRKRPQRAHDTLLKSGVGFLLLTATALLPANAASAQSPQQEYLQQHASALKAQMVRAQVEQAADPSFASKAYEAQQAYLRETAEKSFRIGKPHTTRSQLVSGQADRYQAPSAMPPVHVAPSAHSMPPQRMATRPVQYSAPPQHSAYANPRAYPTAPTTAALPLPADLGDQGESISGPANRVGLQDRLTGFLAKPKYKSTSKLPIPAFETASQGHHAQEQHYAAPTPAKRPSAPRQPLFNPEPRSLEVAELPTPSVSRIDEAAYERMAAAIAEREVGQAIDFQEDRPSRDVVQVAMTTPARQETGFVVPKRQSSVPSFYEPSRDTAGSSTRPTAAKQISVLSKASQQDGDDDNAMIDRLRLQRNDDTLPRPSADSSSDFNSLRRPESSQDDAEKEQLEQRLRELEQETERRETKRRQRELEQEERRSRSRMDRDDLDGDFRSGSDDSDVDNRPTRLTCSEFRTNLLGQSIRDISMDISPRASRVRDQYIAIARSWTDRLGNVIATGAMVDLRRGYVIIDGNGGRQKIPYSKLSDADWAAVSEYWQIPELCSVGDTRLPQRHWTPQSFTWTASSLCHKPLYFENQQLERYGHTHGPVLQPIHSAAHFFVSLATLPYKSAIHPPTECQYALGYYRPGNCAPWLKDPLPISLEGLTRQAVVTTGLSFIP